MLSKYWRIVAAAVLIYPALLAGQQAPAKGAEEVTFTKDIAPILQRSCQNCHRPGSVAPMSLLTYEEARPWARAIKTRTSRRGKPDAMPPWFIEKSIGIQAYKGDVSLSDDEIAKIATWADNGGPRGNPADMPPPLTFASADEWEIGKPDLIVSSPTVFVKAIQPDWWGNLGEVPTGLTEDRYVAAVEIKEINDLDRSAVRRTVGGRYAFHHMVWSVTAGEAGSGAPGASWPVHELGRNADYFDPDGGKLIPAGSKVAFSDGHMHATGVDTHARLDIGIKFHPKGYKPTKKPEQMMLVSTRNLDIRPLEANQTFEAFRTLTQNVKLTVFEPHLHAAGVRMCLDAIWNNTYQTLSCAGYNHSWVKVYPYADDAAPLLPKGTILRVTGYFDTTPANRNLAEPRNWTGMGNRSIDNMMVDISMGIVLTDEEFEQAMAERQRILRLKPGETVTGCPLCGYVRTENQRTPQ
jgi:hypothetical protein